MATVTEVSARVLTLELANGEAAAYEAWRDTARELVAITVNLQQLQAHVQNTAEALKADPSPSASNDHLDAVIKWKPVAEAWQEVQARFQAALQALANAAAPRIATV